MASVLFQVLTQVMPDIDHSDDLLVLFPHKDELCGWNPSFRECLRILVLCQKIDPFLRIIEFYEPTGPSMESPLSINS